MTLIILNMKKVNQKAFLMILLLTLLITYYCAGLFYDPRYIVFIKPFTIPTFLLYIVTTNKESLTLNYLAFATLFYINEILLLFWEDSVPLYKASLIASFFCYLALIGMGYSSIKSKSLFTVPKGFSLFILVLNCIFLLAVLYILTSSINDIILNVIIVSNAIIAVFLGATAVIYLGKFADKKAYYYFFGAFALIFNDIFAAIGTYIIDNIVLNTLDRILHFTAFYIIYLFVSKPKKRSVIVK